MCLVPRVRGLQDEKTLTKYWLTSELHQLKNKANSLKILHLNISSLQYHFAELHTPLTTSEIQFDIIGISESTLKLNKYYTTNIDLPNYNIEHCFFFLIGIHSMQS